MRLINTHTLALEEFFGDIPPYAILSHRWETEEVTFEDYPTQIHPSNTRPMKGWKKILYCIEQAKRDYLRYCWVDTCCIDKSSSAELSEAINSMYAWYRDSDVCYIYLSDVNLHPSDIHNDDWTDQFRSSLWFTRGWTLQELLAPRRRRFYSAAWVTIVADSLVHLVWDITGIPSEALEHFSSTSGSYSVAMKMSWASKRKTTRVEDMAYCLMGIFDINMPLLYGEGSKAFTRLQEEIIKKTHDQSIFCWFSPLATESTYRGLLARSPAEFEKSSDVRPLRVSLADTDIYSLSWETKDNRDKTFGMTNRGLRITLPLYTECPFPTDSRIGPGEFYARLDCLVGPFNWPCFLLLAHLGRGNFARVGVSHHYLETGISPYRESGIPRFKEIFVHEKIDLDPQYTTPRIGRVIFSWGDERAIQPLVVVDVEPRGPGLAGRNWIKLDSLHNISNGTVVATLRIMPESEPNVHSNGMFSAVRFQRGVPPSLPNQRHPTAAEIASGPKHLETIYTQLVDPKYPCVLNKGARKLHKDADWLGTFHKELLDEELEPVEFWLLRQTTVIEDELVMQVKFVML